jgi:hypothetical protein
MLLLYSLLFANTHISEFHQSSPFSSKNPAGKRQRLVSVSPQSSADPPLYLIFFLTPAQNPQTVRPFLFFPNLLKALFSAMAWLSPSRLTAIKMAVLMGACPPAASAPVICGEAGRVPKARPASSCASAHSNALCFAGFRSPLLQPSKPATGAARPRHKELRTARKVLPRAAPRGVRGQCLALLMQLPNEKTSDVGLDASGGASTLSGMEGVKSDSGKSEDPNFVPMASWFLVALLLMTNIHQQWTRALVFYIVSFKAPATEESARLYMNMDLGFGEEQYALLASFGFTLLFTVCRCEPSFQPHVHSIPSRSSKSTLHAHLI